jgi:uncharacterized protein (TIGR03083 family)
MSEMNDNEPVNKDNLFRRIKAGWDEFHAYLDTLTEEQMTVPTDAAGWTVKDHIIHLAKWEAGIAAVLEGKSRAEAMGIDDSMWGQGYDPINAVIQRKYRDIPLETVLETFQQTHDRLLRDIEALSDEDLMLPYNHFVPESDREHPLVASIVGNSFEHYKEHTPWIAAIVAQEQA